MSLEGNPKSDPALEEALEKARREVSEREDLAKKESEEKEFNPEAEEKKIYARNEERMNKLMEFRREAFEKAGKAKEDEGYKSGIQNGVFKSSAEYAAFSDARGRALDKIGYGEKKKKDSEAGLSHEEQAALLYQRKYNEIQRDTESAIEALREKVKASKPEQPKPEEPKAEEP